METRNKIVEDNSQAEERTLAAEVKLYYDLAQATETRSPLLVALHGYGEDKEQMMREARLMAPEGFSVASLQGFHQHIRKPKEPGGPLRYGFGWVTSFRSEDSIALHHRALQELIASLVDESIADGNRVFLLGFSQSCALNYRFAFTHAETLRGVIGICGGLPGDWDESALYRRTDASVLHLTGEHDEFYPPSRVRDYATQLGKRATDVEVKPYDAGHEITERMREDVREWLGKRAG